VVSATVDIEQWFCVLCVAFIVVKATVYLCNFTVLCI